MLIHIQEIDTASGRQNLVEKIKYLEAQGWTQFGSQYTITRNGDWPNLVGQDMQQNLKAQAQEATMTTDNHTYHVIRQDSLVYLANVVNRFMQDGWTPQGGIAYDADTHCFAQAMVRVPKVQEAPKHQEKTDSQEKFAYGFGVFRKDNSLAAWFENRIAAEEWRQGRVVPDQFETMPFAKGMPVEDTPYTRRLNWGAYGKTTNVLYASFIYRDEAERYANGNSWNDDTLSQLEVRPINQPTKQIQQFGVYWKHSSLPTATFESKRLAREWIERRAKAMGTSVSDYRIEADVLLAEEEE